MICEKYPHQFIFVGRLERVKSIDVLVKVWSRLGRKRKDWELVVIGSGSLEKELLGLKAVKHFQFQQPEQLSRHLEMAGCFVLPSRKEPWGVVIHEHAAAGLPLICSDACGAAETFLISSMNGYSYPADDHLALENRMLRIINSPDYKLIEMSKSSHQIGQRIAASTSAANLLSILE